MNENLDQAEQRNLIPPVNEEANRQDSFLHRLSSKDVLTITIFISNALVSTDRFCDNSFGPILHAMVFIYSAFIIKAMFHTILIFANSQNAYFGKISLTTMDLMLNLCYYVAVIAAYFIYKERPEDCFITNTFPTILLFCLVLIGIINISRHALNIFMIILCFPIMVYYFLRNPQSFYSNFGIDPEIVRNLPTIKADSTHVTMCAICTEDIIEGNEILVLRCAGKHYFHGNCIKSWLIQKVNCPICRQENVL